MANPAVIRAIPPAQVSLTIAADCRAQRPVAARPRRRFNWFRFVGAALMLASATAMYFVLLALVQLAGRLLGAV